jgi:hypothetical protein
MTDDTKNDQTEISPLYKACGENARALYRLARELHARADELQGMSDSLYVSGLPDDENRLTPTDPAILGSVIDDTRSALLGLGGSAQRARIGLPPDDVELVAFADDGSDGATGTSIVKCAIDNDHPLIRYVYGSADARADARLQRGLEDDEEMDPNDYLERMEFDRSDAEMLVAAVRNLWPELLRTQ